MNQTNFGFEVVPQAVLGMTTVSAPLPVIAVPGKRVWPPLADRSMRPRVKELAMIRVTLRLTREDFALALQASAHNVNAYLSNRADPPDSILERARKLLADSAGDMAEMEALEKQFANLTMSQILRGWANRLGVGIDQKGSSVLARCTGTTIVTISRWRRNKARPRLLELARYDAMVEQAIKLNPHRTR